MTDFRFTMLRNKVMKSEKSDRPRQTFFIKLIGEAKGNYKLIWENLKKLTGKDHSNTAVEIAISFNSYFIDSVRVLTQNPSTGFLGSVLVI
jgi:hypothetical protein